MTLETHGQANGEATAILLKPNKAKNIVAAKSEDIILATGNLVENMAEAQVIEYVHNARDERGLNAFRLGAGLARLEVSNWTGGHPTFREFVEEDLGMRWNDAKVKMTIYKTLVELGLTWQQFDDLPWSKVVIIAPVLAAENCQEWVTKAKKTTHGELRVMVEAQKMAGASNEGDDVKAKNKAATWSVKLYPDQKEQWLAALDKAKAEANTTFDNVAMDNLATGYLAGSVQLAVPKFDAKQWMKDAGYEAVLMAFEQVFPTVNITVQEPDEAALQGDDDGQ